MSKRNIDLYLQDIIDSIEKIESYTKDINFDRFINDPKTIDAVVRNFFIIGEAIRFIPEKIRDQHPEIPWDEILGMRNKVVHEYFGIDTDILWKTIKEDFPQFKKDIVSLKEEI